jgi:L-cysteine S-thiosulfotransferase
MNPIPKFCASVLAVTVLGSCAAQPPSVGNERLDTIIAGAYPGASAEQKHRSVQDDAQKICSKAVAQVLKPEDALKVTEHSRASIKYPASGKLIGNWKAGEKLAQDGYGLRLLPGGGGDVTPKRANGANCYACHALDSKEINAGNLGVSLAGFGLARGNTPEVQKYAYEKIYNSWTYLPCSQMPRMGANGFLTPEQITHVVAYLLDPESPVNKK